MDPLDISPEEKKTEEKVKQYLRTAGYLPPLTIEDAEAFEKNVPDIPLPPEADDADAVLDRGIHKPVRKVQLYTGPNESNENFTRLAARHGDKLTPDILRQMDEDEARDEREDQESEGR